MGAHTTWALVPESSDWQEELREMTRDAIPLEHVLNGEGPFSLMDEPDHAWETPLAALKSGEFPDALLLPMPNGRGLYLERDWDETEENGWNARVTGVVSAYADHVVAALHTKA